VIFLGTSANDGGSGNLCSRLNQNQNSMDIAANSTSPEAGSLILLDVNAPECIKEGGEDIVLRETENHPNRALKCVKSSSKFINAYESNFINKIFAFPSNQKDTMNENFISQTIYRLIWI